MRFVGDYPCGPSLAQMINELVYAVCGMQWFCGHREPDIFAQARAIMCHLLPLWVGTSRAKSHLSPRKKCFNETSIKKLSRTRAMAVNYCRFVWKVWSASQSRTKCGHRIA